MMLKKDNGYWTVKELIEALKQCDENWIIFSDDRGLEIGLAEGGNIGFISI